VQKQGKPVLLVDIDGVISLWGFRPDRRPDGAFHAIDGITPFLSTAAAGHLHALSLAFDLVWCSGWEEKANEYLPRILGLPGPLPFLTFDSVATGPGHTTPGHWKLAAIDAYLGDRPAAWIDDAFNDACHAWARAREAPTHLEQTNPATGLTDRGVRNLLGFAERL